jgi:processive 1,2-diacylglycerol beta-glucosyltransferase
VRTLILTSSTGGGHNMRAGSFVHWTREISQAAANEIQIHKCLENTHGLYRFGVGLYNRIQRHAPWAHHVYFNFLELAAPTYSRRRLLGIDRFRAILDHVRPRVVLSTHGSLNHGFFDLAREHLGADSVRCVTYCGELFGKYGFSRHWVNPSADLFIGAVPETCAMARLLGMPAGRTVMGGFLLNPNFYRAPLTPEERAAYLHDRLGLDASRFTLLLSTGEHGVNNHLAFLEALHTAVPRSDLQVVALCGRNPADRHKVEVWARSHHAFPVVALSHSTEMHLLLQCASAVVARPGTGTTSEAIVSGCPLIFNALGGFMPQEWITMRFAERHQIAQTVHRADELPPILLSWAKNPELLDQVRERVVDCRPRAHPTRILRLVQKVAESLPALSAQERDETPYVQLNDAGRSVGRGR